MSDSESAENLLEQVEADAIQLQRTLHACARCTLMAVGRNLHLADDACLEVSLKTAIPLSGGIAGVRKQCGGLVGGIMAIGMGMVKYDARTSNPEARKPVMAAAKQFYRWFEREFGNSDCYDIRDIHVGKILRSGGSRRAEEVRGSRWKRVLREGGRQSCQEGGGAHPRGAEGIRSEQIDTGFPVGVPSAVRYSSASVQHSISERLRPLSFAR